MVMDTLMSTPERRYNAQEAADKVGRAYSTIRSHIRQGKLVASQEGRTFQIAEHELRRAYPAMFEDENAPARSDGGATSSAVTAADSAVTTAVVGGAGAAAADAGNPAVTAADSAVTSTDHVSAAATSAADSDIGSGGLRDPLFTLVARLEANEGYLRADLEASAQREELSKARIIDLERELTMRDSLNADLREQVSVLEAKVRETLEERAEENGQLANRIADLVTAHQDMHARVVELQPVAERVPMLQAAVEEKDAALAEKDASLSERERELGNMRQDIEAIASRPVTGPVFRLLTKGKLRR
jgi:hypothetical protein